MRTLWILVISLCFTALSWAQPPESVQFRGENYQLQSTTVGDKVVISLDDPEVKRLVAATAARLQLSSSGKTLYSYLPGRESYWSSGSGVYTRNGQELEAPGLFLAQPPSMERAALLTAIGLRAQGSRLVTEVTQIGPITGDSIDLQLLTSARVKYQASEPEPGLVRLEIPEACWTAPERQFRRGEADISISGGEAEAPLVVQLRYPSFWAPRVKLGLSREILVQLDPRTGVTNQEASLTEIRPLENQEWEFVFDKGVALYWTFEPSSKTLQLDFPGVKCSLPNTRTVRSDRLTLARYSLTLPEATGYEFYQVPEQPQSLRLRLLPGKAPELVGSAMMRGSAGGRGCITLDPGHGGGDPGCHNRDLGVYEKDVTLDICLRLRQLLLAQGWKVELTRDCDRDVTYPGSPDMMELQARADVANRSQADMFVSIHCNANASNHVRGSSVYWWKSADRELAEHLDVLGSGLGFEADGLLHNGFAVLRLTEMPAVLIETAFLTHAEEGRLLATAEVRQAIAERLAEALGRYMAAREPGRRAASKTTP